MFATDDGKVKNGWGKEYDIAQATVILDCYKKMQVRFGDRPNAYPKMIADLEAAIQTASDILLE